MKVSVQATSRNVVVDYELDCINFDVTGLEIPQSLSASFAVWLLLPIAMRRGEDLHILGAVDPAVLSNARKLVEIWTMWCPDKYKPISVSVDCEKYDPAPKSNDSVMLYSGGVDSTFVLAGRESDSGISHALTIHGLDYDFRRPEPFKNLLRKTGNLLDENNISRIVVRTDAARKIGDLKLTHAFVLASCLFFCSHHFARGIIAADMTPAEEMMFFPWGTNHVTNAYFASSKFRMVTLGSDFDRMAKLERLLTNPVALQALTFCSNKEHRPDNCGVCPKCLRNKCMLIAIAGALPSIFSDPRFGRDEIESIDFGDMGGVHFYYNIARVAKERGHLGHLPGLEQHLERSKAAKSGRTAIEKLSKGISKIVRLR